jgi:peptidoglycan/xylan/chitin deacetylase (PgdA/CDA1 family)
LRTRFDFLTPDVFLSGSQPGVLLTFDDGLANNVTHALPLLEKYGAPAVFFVTVQHTIDSADWLPASRKLAQIGWPDGAYDIIAHSFFDGMTAAQLRDCGKHPLLTIGGHTWSHPFLTQCSDTQLVTELTAARRYLAEATGQTIDLFAYPTGDYDRRVALAVQLAGYRAAFVESTHNLGLPQFEIPRVGLYRADPVYLSAKFSGLHQPALKQSYA